MMTLDNPWAETINGGKSLWSDDDFRLHFYRFGFGTLYCQSREVAYHVCDVDVYFVSSLPRA